MWWRHIFRCLHPPSVLLPPPPPSSPEHHKSGYQQSSKTVSTRVHPDNDYLHHLVLGSVNVVGLLRTWCNTIQVQTDILYSTAPPPPRPRHRPRAYLHVRWLWQVAAPGGPESPISSYTGGWWPPVSHGDCVQTCTVNTDTAINMLTHSYTAINMLLSWDHQFITEHFAALTFTSCNMLTLLTRTIYTCIYQHINCNGRLKFK